MWRVVSPQQHAPVCRHLSVLRLLYSLNVMFSVPGRVTRFLADSTGPGEVFEALLLRGGFLERTGRRLGTARFPLSCCLVLALGGGADGSTLDQVCLLLRPWITRP